MALPPQSAVHPRVGGEQLCGVNFCPHIAGSSPRGRGTEIVVGMKGEINRFIPAWAGNSPSDGKRCGVWSVHPRVGGEQVVAGIISQDRSGSSPRGRGTATTLALFSVVGRFIPAWAGNSCQSVSADLAASVHPRVGGEQYPCARGPRGAVGSSPRGRGTGSNRRTRL
ncbi:MAG: hypothetical protein RL186_1159 [Pseudomonadota bacterium]